MRKTAEGETPMSAVWYLELSRLGSEKRRSRFDIWRGVAIPDDDFGSNSQFRRSERIKDALCRLIVRRTSELTHLN